MSRPRSLLPTKSLIALLAALAAVAVIAVLSYRSLDQRADAAAAVRHSSTVQRLVYQFLATVTDAETGQRGFVITGDEHYLAPYEQARGALPGQLAALQSLVADNAEQQRRVQELEPILGAKLIELARTVELRREGNTEGAVAGVKTDRGKVMMDRIRELVAAISSIEEGVLADRDADWEAAVRWSSLVTFGGVAVIALMIMLTGVFASRDYRNVESEAWVRRVQLALGTKMQGDFKPESLADKVLSIIVDQLDAVVGAVYLYEPGDRLQLVAGHALEPTTRIGSTIKIGDGLAGEAAKQRRVVHLRDLPDGYLRVVSATGGSRPHELVVVPAIVDGTVQAIIELGFFHAVHVSEMQALERASESIAVAVRTARDRSRLEELLAETQRQAEELQAQQEELRVTNEELEQQSRTLQLSQSQLENQQAELEQINAQLEEQSNSLERQRDELARAGAELRRSNEYKSEFLANMSHELRTPLNSSLILAKLLADNRDGNLNAEQIKFAQTIYTAGNDLLTLINDILDLSKIEAGMLDVRAESVPLARVLDDLASTFQPVAAQKRLALDLRVAPGAPESIETDSMRLSQILKNLMSNALKFTEDGGVSLEISATADGRVGFAVHDTGIGISTDQHDAIFEAFRQADGASNRKFGGTGLGLSISRDLARLLGGDLVVDSKPGHGSTFTLVLPVRHASAASPVSTRQRPPTPPLSITAAPIPDDRAEIGPSSRSLLVVEDDLVFAKVIHDLAHELEFLVIVA
ncbi:MAG TPA: CHASE3 domain-containing protein, partial [Kofleriaceae bacterium]|nr:CHASE3 domain-containing protein [Kofleriaceae bacterium]